MEDNKLIAEFMGLVYAPPSKRWDDWFTEDGTRVTFGSRIPLLYHTSWDWLMPVVDKIESLGYSYDRVNADVFINSQEGGNIIPNPMDCNNMTMLQKTHFIVVEFIKFYNQNK